MRLEIDRVRHRYDRLVAVDDVSLRVGEGETLCLLGPSGCGKSTLLRLIAGLEELQQGRIRIDGEVVAGDGASVPAERRGVGLVFQDYALFPHLTVLENAAFGLAGVPAAARAARGRALLEQMGLRGLARAYPHTLSGGEQQRVALARALAPEPRVLLLDEPFAGLDVRLRDRLREETLRLLRTQRITSILVTHDPEEAMFLADRVVVLNRGRVVQEGVPVDLYRRPANPFVARFFGPINSLRGQVRNGAVRTALGVFAAPGLAEGTDVEVVIRPEALRLTAGEGGGAAATVVDVHRLGPSSLLDLTLPGEPDPITARVPGVAAATVGESVRVVIDPADILVFPSAAG